MYSYRMSKKELDKSLQDLRAEIDKLGAENDDIKEKIDTLATGIEGEINNLDNTKYIDSLIQNIQQHIEQLETEHPRITGVLNRIMVTLSGLGI